MSARCECERCQLAGTVTTWLEGHTAAEAGEGCPWGCSSARDGWLEGRLDALAAEQ